MKLVTVYWRNSPEEMGLLSSVPHVAAGPDGEELIISDESLAQLRALVREHELSLWVDSVQDVAPRDAVEVVRRAVPAGPQQDAALAALVELVAREDAAAAQHLRQELRLGARG